MWVMGLSLYMSCSCGGSLAFAATPLAGVWTGVGAGAGRDVTAVMRSASIASDQRLDEVLKFAEPRARRVFWKPRKRSSR